MAAQAVSIEVAEFEVALQGLSVLPHSRGYFASRIRRMVISSGVWARSRWSTRAAKGASTFAQETLGTTWDVAGRISMKIRSVW